MVDASLPVSFVEGVRCKHNVVSVALSCQVEGFLFVLLDELLEVFGRNLFVYQELVFDESWHFDEHGHQKLNAVQNLEVNLHVVGDKSAAFFVDEFDRFILNLAHGLSEELLKPGVAADVYKNVVTFLDTPDSEGGKSYLSKCSVVKHLVFNLLQVDHRAHLCFHQQILRLFYLVVERQVVHLEESRFYS